MRLFWKINEYTKPMALMYNCWHTRKREEDKLFLLNMTLIVHKCRDRLTLPSTQMSRVIFSRKSAETKESFVKSAS